MTTPTSPSVSPALRSRIAAILAPFAPEVGDVLAAVADNGAGDVRDGAQFDRAWGHAIDAAYDLLDRATTADEILALEVLIRAHLEAGAEPAPPRKPIPEPPTHPLPAVMARAAHPCPDNPMSAFATGVTTERMRLAALLLTMAEEHRESARLLNDPAPRGVSEALEAAEHQGAEKALLELAGELGK